MSDEFPAKVYAKLEEIGKDIVELKITSAKQEVNLQDHMRRSDLLEKRDDVLEAKLEPVITHVKHVEGALKLLGVIALVVGFLAGCVKIYEFFARFFH